MPDLNYQVEAAEPQHFAAAPLMLFKVRLTEAVRAGAEATPIRAGVLRVQVQIEPARRRYAAAEQDRLSDLFGTPDRWGQTLKPLLWTHVGAAVPPFTGTGTMDLVVPCSADFCLAATKYFAALDGGEVPLCFLFSGTLFYETAEDGLQVAQVPWDREAYFRLPAATWHALMEHYYPNSSWLSLRKDVFDRLNQYRSRQGLPTWEQALERLLSAAGEQDSPRPGTPGRGVGSAFSPRPGTPGRGVGGEGFGLQPLTPDPSPRSTGARGEKPLTPDPSPRSTGARGAKEVAT